jgi:hypothetical protein
MGERPVLMLLDFADSKTSSGNPDFDPLGGDIFTDFH